MSVEAVAQEVATAIELSKISLKLLTKLNNDPTRLLTHIKSVHPIDKQGFSSGEVKLYERAIDLSAQYIIDLAGSLPEYTASNFTEVLQRIDTSMRKLDEVLEELDRLAEASESDRSRKSADF